MGAGRYDVDVDSRRTVDFSPFPCLLPQGCEIASDFKRKQNTAYIYSNVFYPYPVTWTLGLSYNSFDDEELRLDLDNADPKFGIQWQIHDRLLLRGAIFNALKRALVADQTIEPTQIAGFNQFYDDISGSEITQYGVGLDARLARQLYGGAELVRRELDVPLLVEASASTVIEDQREDTYRAYLDWAPHASWALSGELRYDRFKRDDPLNDIRRPTEVETISLPLSLRYFNQAGFFSEIGLAYVHQDVARSTFATAASGEDDFFVLDAAIGYRLPRRRGIISLEGANLLDEHFFSKTRISS